MWAPLNSKDAKDAKDETGEGSSRRYAAPSPIPVSVGDGDWRSRSKRLFSSLTSSGWERVVLVRLGWRSGDSFAGIVVVGTIVVTVVVVAILGGKSKFVCCM